MSEANKAAEAMREALEQALSCILGETPEDMTHEDARDDTLQKIRSALNRPIPAPQPDPRRSVDEIRAEVERLRAEPDRFSFTAIRIATLEWALSATPEPAK